MDKSQVETTSWCSPRSAAGACTPSALELIGKARELEQAAPWLHAVKAALVGERRGRRTPRNSRALWRLREIAVYDDPGAGRLPRGRLRGVSWRITSSAAAPMRGAGGRDLALGRSLAPRLATRFPHGPDGGLHAPCILRDTSDLVQISSRRFGGNIMAQIVTSRTRPAVRHRALQGDGRARAQWTQPDRRDRDAARCPHGRGRIQGLARCACARRARRESSSISDAEILVVGGRGLRQRERTWRWCAELAAASRAATGPRPGPLVEKGWAANDRQIGLSGRTVRPRLIITCGVSGAIQFTACMNGSDHIVSINTDKDAPIFEVAHIGIVGDLYEIIPALINQLKEAQA